jgi:hypothetical protein
VIRGALPRKRVMSLEAAAVASFGASSVTATQ